MTESSEPAGSTGSAGSPRRRLRSLTLTALLGIFIVAVFFAVARRFLPRAVRRAMDRRTGRH
jgi:hypothetical protein